MSNTFDKLPVLDSFIEEVNSYLPEIEANLNHLRTVQQSSPDLSTSDMEALEETYRRTHTIGGSASMMDFPGLAHVAHGMEDILGDVLDGMTTLDLATIDLLRRSLGRMHRLLDGIRTGIDEDAVIEEDDADYDQYGAAIESSTQAESPAETPPQEDESTQITDTMSRIRDEAYASSTPNPSQIPSESSMPSLDEMVASFHTPNTAIGEEVAWPEEPAPQFDVNVPPQEEVQDVPQTTSEQELPVVQQPSAL